MFRGGPAMFRGDPSSKKSYRINYDFAAKFNVFAAKISLLIFNVFAAKVLNFAAKNISKFPLIFNEFAANF